MIIIIFQFLLVRLKVNLQKCPQTVCRKFQFLLVRLKVAVAALFMSPPPVFQFLLVRLKVLTVYKVQPEKAYFNSYWCD